MDYNIFIPILCFILGIILKTLLDFNLAIYIVKYLHWIPVRSIFRTKPTEIAGNWSQIWEDNMSEKYTSEQGRKSNIKIKQWGKYLYGEFNTNNDEKYYLFGEIIGSYIIGKWFDKNSIQGYYGSFELRIIDKKNLKGRWMGHSNNNPNQINCNDWTMEKYI